jgi:molybdopterin converting factor small subunit
MTAKVEAALADENGAQAVIFADNVDHEVQQHERALAAERDAVLAALRQCTAFGAKVRNEANRVRELIREGTEIIKLP